MIWEQKPPYNVLKTPQFPESDLQKAASLARAVNLFYTQGRAVSWFNCIIYHLHKKPSVFLGEFEKYLREEKIMLPPEPSLIAVILLCGQQSKGKVYPTNVKLTSHEMSSNQTNRLNSE